MSSIVLFDSRVKKSTARFARGLPRTNRPFEPTAEDRAWAASEFANSDRTTSELQDIENNAVRIADRLAECRAASERCAAILNDQPTPTVSAVATFKPSAYDWADYAKCRTPDLGGVLVWRV